MSFRSIFYRTAANLIALLHLTWIALIAGGTVYIFFFHHHRFVLVYAGLVGIGLLALLVTGGICPLTWLEEKLRKHQNANFSFRHSFIVYHLNHIFKTNWTENQVNFSLLLIYIFFGTLDVLLLFYR